MPRVKLAHKYADAIKACSVPYSAGECRRVS